jgi:hypothetical protein
VYSCTHWLRASNPPPHLGSYTRALLVSHDRRHLFVTPGCNEPYFNPFLCVLCTVSFRTYHMLLIFSSPVCSPRPHFILPRIISLFSLHCLHPFLCALFIPTPLFLHNLFAICPSFPTCFVTQCCGSGSGIRDPGLGTFLTPGSGIRDPG